MLTVLHNYNTVFVLKKWKHIYSALGIIESSAPVYNLIWFEH